MGFEFPDLPLIMHYFLPISHLLQDWRMHFDLQLCSGEGGFVEFYDVINVTSLIIESYDSYVDG